MYSLWTDVLNQRSLPEFDVVSDLCLLPVIVGERRVLMTLDILPLLLCFVQTTESLELKRIKQLMMVEDEEPAAEPAAAPEPSTPSSSSSSSSSSSGAESGKAYPSVTKWESGVSRGRANPVGNTKWESGLTRGKANQVGVTKWESGTKRGKGNTLL